MAQAKLVNPAEFEALNHHVALHRQVLCNLLALRCLKVQRHGPLVVADTVEIRRFSRTNTQASIARVVSTAGMLNFDDLCAELARHHDVSGLGKGA